jgi:hypothetical protein
MSMRSPEFRAYIYLNFNFRRVEAAHVANLARRNDT